MIREGRRFLTGTNEYDWLVNRFRTASELTQTGGSDSNILDAILSLVCDHTEFTFDLEWDPIAFMHTQYADSGSVRLGSVIFICGCVKQSEAITCEDYVKRMWPAVGFQVLANLNEAVQAGHGFRTANSKGEAKTL